MTDCRTTLRLWSFIASVVLYILRVNLSVAIVSMVGRKKHSLSPSFKPSCPVTENISQENVGVSVDSGALLDWDEETQGTILGSFFVGYLFTNFVGGRLAEMVGGKLVCGGGIGLTAVLSLFLPFSAHSAHLFAFIRFLQGMTEGVVFPSLHVLCANWIPLKERSFFLSLLVAGNRCGALIALLFGGYLAQGPYDWPSVFYLPGFVGIAWCVVWFRCIYDSPSVHPTITKTEKEFLNVVIEKKQQFDADKVPYSSIIHSVPFSAVVVAHFTANFGFYLLLTELPTYFSTVHNLDMKNNGFASALPYAICMVFSFTWGWLADRIIKRGYLTVRQLRKFSTVISHFVPMACLFLLPYAGCQVMLAIILVTLVLISGTVAASGFLCGFQDLAPNLAGTTCGISNTVATIPGFLAPHITGILINEEPIIENWQRVFFIGSFLYLIGGAYYLSRMSVDIQAWNYGRNKQSGMGKHSAIVT